MLPPSMPPQPLPDFPSAPLPDDPSRVFVGTSHPILLVGSDPQGKWALICQARKDTDGDGKNWVEFGHHGGTDGDEMELFFVEERGAGERLDNLVAVSPSGDHLALRGTNGRLILRNVRTKSIKELSTLEPDDAVDPSPAMPQRMVRFDPTGRYLAILQERPHPLVIMDLATNEVRSIDLGPGRVWTFHFDQSGQWIFIRMVVKDANGNGELDLPRLESTRLGGGFCDAPASYSTGGFEGKSDDTERRVVHIAGHRAEVVPDASWSLGKFGVVYRNAQGAVMQRRINGEVSELVPADCQGIVSSVNATYGVVLMACGAAPILRRADAATPQERDRLLNVVLPKTAEFVAFSTRGRHSISTKVTRAMVGYDEFWRENIGRLMALDTTLDAPQEYINLVTWKIVRTRSDQHLCGEDHGKLYMSDENGPTEILDIATGAVRPVAKGACGMDFLIPAAPWVIAGNELLNMSQSKIVGTIPDNGVNALWHANDSSGRFLLFAKEAKPATKPYQASIGPLEWIAFRPR